MAMKNEVRYIQFRTEGTAARKVASPAPFENTLKLPRRVKRKRLVVRLDPVAILGTAVALGMLIAMVVGLVLCYAFGSLWFLKVYTSASGAMAMGTVLAKCVVPFLIPDGVKILLAALLVRRLQGHIKTA